MKPLIKYILAFLLISLGIGAYVIYTLNRPNYIMGEDSGFKIKEGEEFSLRIPENGFTGYSNCWRNENHCNNIKRVKEEYKSYLFKNDCDGCGGLVTWTFKGIQRGKDTIFISLCPVGYVGKPCESFRLDSLTYLSQDSVSVNGITYSSNEFLTYDYIIPIIIE
jgi:predicted secreted protein